MKRTNTIYLLSCFFGVVTILTVRHWMIPIAHVQPVERGKIVEVISAAACTKAKAEVILKARESGLLELSVLSPGLSVKKGEILAKIDSQDLEQAYQIIQNTLEAKEKNWAFGPSQKWHLIEKQKELEKNESFYQQGRLSKQELASLQRHCKAIEEAVEKENINHEEFVRNAKMELTGLHRKIEETTLVSPMEGTVVAVYAFPGEQVQYGQPLARILSKETIIEATINEEDLANITVQQPITLQLLACGEKLFSGHISQILPTAETGRITAYLTLDNPPFPLNAGLTGQTSIITGERDNTLLIPRRALMGEKVFVLNKNCVELRSVKLGYRNFHQAEITEGLREGELVLVEKLDTFKAGQKVRQ